MEIRRDWLAIAALFTAQEACMQSGRVHERETTSSASSAGCDTRTWVGVRANPAAPCPTVTGEPTGSWFVQDPFASVAPAPQRTTEMCTYTWVPGTSWNPTDAQLARLLKLAASGSQLTRLDQSCLIVSSTSQELADHLWVAANEAFLRQADKLALLPEGTVPRTTINVALVDTVPDSDGLLETPVIAHLHGRALGMLIDQLACPDPMVTCPLHMSTHLAFGRYDEQPFIPLLERGAFVGRPSDLMVAINQAVDTWRSNGSPDRLVINLSLGWYENTSPGASPGDYAADTTGVLNALAEASCYGALVIAAAGNTTEGPIPHEGPMFPAAWEQRVTPTHAECWSEYGIATDPTIRSEQGPLLFSVGAVDGLDRPATSVRPGGRPRLVAPSEQGAERTILSFGTAFESMLTGSSLSAAVGTAAAAVAWSYHPELTATEIAELLYQGGEPLTGQNADYCLGGPCDEIHRLSLCGTVQAACDGGPLTCPTSFSCPRRPAFNDDRLLLWPKLVKDLDTVIPLVPTPPGPWSTTFVGDCGADVEALVTSTNEPCPNRQYFNSMAEPATSPLPGELPCRPCAMTHLQSNQYRLYVSINPLLSSGAVLVDPSIELVYGTGLIRYVSVPLGPLTAGDEKSINLQLSIPGFHAASISFRVSSPTGQHSTKDPLVLD